ncbi:MAG: heme-binding protein [Dehalococcoidales bacterium]|nr:heme-binding protein [Dehalococcoidales bacterium]
MYEKKFLGLAEAEVATRAIIKEASKEPSRPVTVVVMDSRGDIITLVRMDGATALYNKWAIIKANVAATRGMDTRQYFQARMNKERSGEWGAYEPPGDDQTYIPGGVAIIEPGKTAAYGGIGVSGRKADEDETLAYLGLRALQEYLWPLK